MPAHILQVYRDQGIEILCANSPLDPYLIHYLEDKLRPVAFPTHRCRSA